MTDGHGNLQKGWMNRQRQTATDRDRQQQTKTETATDRTDTVLSPEPAVPAKCPLGE